MIFVLLLSCSRPAEGPLPPDAAPFAPVLRVLDRDHDGIVSTDEAPEAPDGLRMPPLDANDDGVVSAVEVRDAVYAVDPATFDPEADPRASAGGVSPPAAEPGPLAQALRFLADEAAARTPGAALPSSSELDAAAAAGMSSPAGTAVLTALRAAGAEIPPSIAAAGPDQPPGHSPYTVKVQPHPPLVSHGPGAR